MNPYTKKIARVLEKVSGLSGQRPHNVFEDWTEMVEATLRMLPYHAASLQKGEGMVEDTPDIQELWARLRHRYQRADEGFTLFANALVLLFDSTSSVQHGAPLDVLGEVFMTFASPNANRGQIFTPWEVAVMMARMQGIGQFFHARLKEAVLRHPLGEAMLLSGYILASGEGEGVDRFFIDHLIPLALNGGDYEPITIYDCACGSGVMLLAASTCVPAWANHLRLVEYYGCDIDATCARMATINMRLYGLNGYGLQLAQLTDWDHLTELQAVRCENALLKPAAPGPTVPSGPPADQGAQWIPKGRRAENVLQLRWEL